MATASYTNVDGNQVRVWRTDFGKVYEMPDGELLLPGEPRHSSFELMVELTPSQQRKALTLIRLIKSGEFDVFKTATWTDEQRSRFVNSLPETEV
jgi:hypothetical protein